MDTDSICNNYIIQDDIKDYFISYSTSSFYYIACMIISSLSFIVNVLTLYIYVKNKSSTKTPMDKYLIVIIIIDFLNIIYSFIVTLTYSKPENLYKYCGFSIFLSLFCYFCLILNLSFTTFSIIQLRGIVLDPIEGILKSEKNLKLYLSFSISLSFCFTLLAYMINMIGYSPYLTPFIKSFSSLSSTYNLKALIILLIPSLFFLTIFFLIISTFLNNNFRKDKELINIYSKCFIFAASVLVCYLPTCLLFFLSFGKPSLSNSSSLKVLSQIAYMFFCFQGALLGIVKIFQKMYRVRQSHQSNEMNKRDSRKSFEEDLDKVQTMMIRRLLNSIFIGLSYCIYDTKINQDNESNNQTSESENENQQYKKLRKENYSESRIYRIENDNAFYNNFPVIKQEMRSGENIKLYEYSGKVFKYLRRIDHITNDNMLYSFHPEMNQQKIESTKGKGGSFFISTFDNCFLIKTLTRNELDTIVKFILNKYTRHKKRFQSSILCPIYGLFSIEFSKGVHIYFAIMQNVIGPFSEIIHRQYDMKGSTLGRVEEVDLVEDREEIKKKTLKDLNFNEFEMFFDINKEDTLRLLTQLEEDAYMLSECDVIDYSLFVIVIDLEKKTGDSLIDSYIKELKMRNNNTFNRNLNLMRNNSLSEFETRHDTNTNNNASYMFNIKKMIGKVFNPNQNQNQHNKLTNEMLFQSSNIQANLLDVKNLYNNDFNSDSNRNSSFANQNEFFKKHLYLSNSKRKGYIFSVIDYFQYYNLLKFFETNYKTYISNKEEYGISCVKPDMYYERFVSYITKCTYDYDDQNECQNQVKMYYENMKNSLK